MSNELLPNYLKAASPNPMENRAPWYKNTAPAYAGIFLSAPFMAGMAGALAYGNILAAVIGLVMGAFFCLAIYYVPAKLGMKTGMPLYVVASSTFGAQGGVLVPGILMGVVQVFWHAVFTTTAASFFIQAMGWEAGPNTAVFWIVCAVWGLAMALVGAVGIGLLGKLSSWLPIFPLAFIILAAFMNRGGLAIEVAWPALKTMLSPLRALLVWLSHLQCLRLFNPQQDSSPRPVLLEPTSE